MKGRGTKGEVMGERRGKEKGGGGGGEEKEKKVEESRKRRHTYNISFMYTSSTHL